MTPPEPGTSATVGSAPPTTHFAAVVSQHGTLTPLYDADNRVHYVPEADADDYLRQGFSRQSAHLATAAQTLNGLFLNAQSAVEQLVDDTTQRKALDRGADQALATAHFAMDALVKGFSKLIAAMHAQYPTIEAEPTVIEVNGVRLHVDPNQADGTTHAEHRDISPSDDPSTWTEAQRRAAGLISTIPPHLADPNDPFAYAADSDPAIEHAAFLKALTPARRQAAQRQAATGATEEGQPS